MFTQWTKSSQIEKKPPDTFEGHPMADYSSIELKIESCQVCV